MRKLKKLVTFATIFLGVHAVIFHVEPLKLTFSYVMVNISLIVGTIIFLAILFSPIILIGSFFLSRMR